ncbi:MAG TPA: recombinase family protein, partial [Anaerolineaceae bacterium]|nr:recombinase family protein [Anaerolineaceae bacterium]
MSNRTLPIPLPQSGAELERRILAQGITPPSNQVTVAVYERVSRYDERVPSYSMEIQPDRAAEYARSQGWTIHKIYSDPNFSGKNSYRPEF